MTASEAAGAHGSAEHTAERSVADVALDLFVYAPAGALLTAASDMPAMAAKGRERVEQELRNAHVVGRFVVDTGMRQVRRQLGALIGEHPTPQPAPPSTTAPPTSPRRARPGATAPTRRPPTRKPAQGLAPSAPFTGTASTTGPAPGGHTAAPARDAAVDRAIPDYDTLSASQVVRRLDGLKAPELRAVVRHELANRGRRTVLHRAEQLLGDGGAPPATPPGTA